MPPTHNEDLRLIGKIQFLLEAVTFLYRHHQIDPTELTGILSGTTPEGKPTDYELGDVGLINEGWNETYKYMKIGAGF